MYDTISRCTLASLLNGPVYHMKLLFDFFPIVLFFVVYKLSDIYMATGVAMVASLFQVAFLWFKYKQIEKPALITLVSILVLGGATLLLHDEWFIKWKPTVLYWALAVAFLFTQFIGQKKPLIRRMLEKSLVLPSAVWSTLNLSWVIFFTLMGFANLFVIHHFDTETWVNFKLFGTLGLTLLFIVIQAIYMAKHVEIEK